MKILVTGCSGYVGSHTCLELLSSGFEIVGIDNLCNSSLESLSRVEKLCGKKITFYKKDLRDSAAVTEIFAKEGIDAVIHFAGLKAVGESVSIPLEYYDNNIGGSLVLFQAMKTHVVRKIVFSSSATVYGSPKTVPINEDFPLSATNPYGRSKLILEEILRDLYKSDSSFNISILRYFNPVGAHESGLIGEDPNGIPNNLMPFVSSVAVGKLPFVNVFGNDYDTPDGTGVRDYIHVVDLAKGHIKALEALNKNPGLITHNLGTGKGYSVLDLIQGYSKACGKDIPYKITERRPGDIAICYADTEKARDELGFVAEKNLDDMCKDSWNWQKNNPNGYAQ